MKMINQELTNPSIEEEIVGISVAPGRLALGKQFLAENSIMSLSEVTDEMILSFRRWIVPLLERESDRIYQASALEIMRNWYYRKEVDCLYALCKEELPDSWLVRRILAYMAAHGIRDPEQVNADLRIRIKDYYQAMEYRDLRSVLRYVDRIKLMAIRKKKELPIKHNMMPRAEDRVFLLYYPTYEAAQILYRSQKREELMFDMTLLAGDVIRNQFRIMIHHVMNHIQGNRYYFSEYRAMALKELFDTAVSGCWEDIELLCDPDERTHLEAMSRKHQGTAANYMQVLHMMRQICFRNGDEYRWDATVWYLDQIPIESYRTTPGDMISTLSFAGIEQRENRSLFQEYMRYLVILTDRSLGTVRGLYYRLLELMKFCDKKEKSVSCLNAEDYDEFFCLADAGSTADYFNRYIDSIVYFYQFLIQRGRLKKMPFLPELYRKKEVRVHHAKSVSEEDQEKILSALAEFPETLRLMFLHLWALGLRISEVTTLTAEGYFIKDGVAWLRVYQNKMRSEKVIPIPLELYQLMQNYIKSKGITAKQYVFQRCNGGAYSTSAFRDQMKRLCDRFGINSEEYRFRSHDFRHTLATALYQNEKVPLSVIRDYLGHRYSEMTMWYIDCIPAELEKKSREYFESHNLGGN